MTAISNWLESRTPEIRQTISRYNIIMAREVDTLVCGVNNRMPWYIVEDLDYFRQMTMGHTVVMGRNTMESLNAIPLKGRTNVVLSSTMVEAPEGFTLLRDIGDVSLLSGKIFFIGGPTLLASVLQDFVSFPEYNLYLTEIKGIPRIDLPRKVFLHDIFLFRKFARVTEFTKSGWMRSMHSTTEVNFLGYHIHD